MRHNLDDHYKVSQIMEQKLARQLQAMPKAEIHVHLIGAIAAEIV